MEVTLNGWEVFQDVHDLGETLKIFTGEINPYDYTHLMSPWEPAERLTYLQKLFSDHPYYGRELRQFNAAPWWYRCGFTLDEIKSGKYHLMFRMVDYYCRVWINGEFCGEHSGYQEAFWMDITPYVRQGGNEVYVKVWAPWDTELEKGGEDKRFFSVKRRMVKGTYEHADGFIQRDVNPVGIVGPVTLFIREKPWIKELLVHAQSDGTVTVEAEIGGTKERLSAQIDILDPDRQICLSDCLEAPEQIRQSFRLKNPSYWHTWDRGEQPLYTAVVRLTDHAGAVCDVQSKSFGFSYMEIVRTKEKTEVRHNGTRIFLRGTSYFPDVYFADLPKERLRRDLTLMRQAGINAVRVHVHVQQEHFYELCDEMGFLVFQDTDFSWNHPVEKAWVDQGIRIFKGVVRKLCGHPSLGCWILLNEPDKWKTSVVTNYGCSLTEIISRNDSISKAIGERLVETVRKLDPHRAYIRASYNEDDPESGDSHNYIGSLRGQDTNYEEIRGTTEKLNTEFGMDAPGCPEDLSREPKLYGALKPVLGKLDVIQRYQYKLLKYYIEHYRVQKYRPCSGYFQFMFVDLCPQSFYGVYDYWGTPKPGLLALSESNQPVAVMAVRAETECFGAVNIVIANDTEQSYNGCISWTFMRAHTVIGSGKIEAQVGCDEVRVIGTMGHVPDRLRGTELFLSFRDEKKKLIACNHYTDPFLEDLHIKGHPSEIDSELGVRLFRPMA